MKLVPCCQPQAWNSSELEIPLHKKRIVMYTVFLFLSVFCRLAAFTLKRSERFQFPMRGRLFAGPTRLWHTIEP